MDHPKVDAASPAQSGAGGATSSIVVSNLRSERVIILLIAGVQFVNILDFVMVMPLGPDFAQALGIETSHLGVVGGSYTLAAGASGLIGSMFLDRFDRRVALAVAMLGLVVATALGGMAVGLGSLLAARVMAGAFGGPATSLSLAIIADAIPPERRGRALGSVMASFSVASVVGVPLGLELSRRFGWRMPFFAVAGLGFLVSLLCITILPPFKKHLAAPKPTARVSLFEPLTLASLGTTALVTLGVFAVVPNISAYLQHNAGYPREQLGLLYLVGGVASLFAMRIVGSLVDRAMTVLMVWLGTLLHVLALVFGFLYHVPAFPMLLVFTLYMLSGSVRMVPLQSLFTRVPSPERRARFMSAQSAVSHFASATGAMLASWFLVAAPDGRLENMEPVAVAAVLLALGVPFGASYLNQKLNAQKSIDGS